MALAEANRLLAGHEATIAGHARLVESLDGAVKERAHQLDAVSKECGGLKLSNQNLTQELASLNRALSEARQEQERERKAAAELRKTVREQSAVIAKLTD